MPFLGIIRLNCHCVAWGLQKKNRLWTTFAVEEHFIRLFKQKNLLQWHKRREINKFLKFWSSGMHPRPGVHSISIKSWSCYTQLPFNWISRIQNNCAKFTEMPKNFRIKIDRFPVYKENFCVTFFTQKRSVALRRQNHFCRLFKCGFWCGIGNLSQRDEVASNASLCVWIPFHKKPTKKFHPKTFISPEN